MKNTMIAMAGLLLAMQAWAMSGDVPELTTECVDDDSARSCWSLGEHADAAEDSEAALRWYRAACDLDVDLGCRELAQDALDRGRDDEAAVIYRRMCLFEPARSGGTSGAAGCVALAAMTDDPGVSADWYKRGCEKRDLTACRAVNRPELP